jgi:hypothetical protein
VDVIALVDHFLWSGTCGGDTLGGCVPGESSESVTAACEVSRASAEVVRALDATHSAIALRRAPAGGKTYARMGVQ